MDEFNDIEVIPNGHVTITSPLDVHKSKERRVEGSSDVNHNNARVEGFSDVNHNNENKSRIAFLDILQDSSNNRGGVTNTSPDKSPTMNAKPFVPPLDFSTLHQNVGGQGRSLMVLILSHL